MQAWSLLRMAKQAFFYGNKDRSLEIISRVKMTEKTADLKEDINAIG